MKTLIIVLFMASFAFAETKVTVFSSALVTPTNKNGKRTIDIDTPEGAAIFGGAEAVVKYKGMANAPRIKGDKIADLEKELSDLKARIKKLEER